MMDPKLGSGLWGRGALEPREREGIRVDPTGRAGFKCVLPRAPTPLRYQLRRMLRCCCDARDAALAALAALAGLVAGCRASAAPRWFRALFRPGPSKRLGGRAKRGSSHPTNKSLPAAPVRRPRLTPNSCCSQWRGQTCRSLL
jgi:hypothetical protein